MLSFHNDPAKKEFYVQRMLKHAEMDEIIQGIAWDNGKGCFIGCSFHNYKHSMFESEIGLPLWLAKVSDKIFEGLSNQDAKRFASEFYQKVPVGKDLNKIKISFLIVIVESVLDKFDHKKYPDIKEKINKILIKLKDEDFKSLDATATATATAAAYAATAATSYAAAAAATATADAADAAAATAAAAADAADAADAAAATAAAAADAADAATSYAAAATAAAAADAADAAAYRLNYKKSLSQKQYKYFADELFRLMEGLDGNKNA